MEVKHYNLDNYKLHMYKTDKFKKITMRISFKRNVVKEEITMRGVISHLLILSCQKYPSERLLSNKMESLYGSSIWNSNVRVGSNAKMIMDLVMLDDIYTEKDNSIECLKTLKEIIFNPNIIEDRFDSKTFDLVKEEIAAQLKLEKENTDSYSLNRLFENMDPVLPLSYRNGYIEDLKEITEKNAYTYYLDMLKNDLIDIYVVGNIDFEDFREKICNIFPFAKRNVDVKSVFVEHTKFFNKIKEIKEKDEVSQAVMMIGCKIKTLTNFEYQYVMPLYNNILGGSPSSKIFQSIREKNSLAYHASSLYRRADNVLIIWAGINKDNYDQVLVLVKEALNSMGTNKVTIKELNTAKAHFIRNLNIINDSPKSIIANAMTKENYDLDSIEEQKEKINTVTIDDINKINAKIILDTVYMLHGGE